MDSSSLGLNHRVISGKRLMKDKPLSKSRSDDVRANNKPINKRRNHDHSNKRHGHYDDADEHYGDYRNDANSTLDKYHSKHYGSFSKQLISGVPPQPSDEVPTLQRLREKIEAIRLVDPYYQTKLSQHELDNFIKESNDKRHHHGDGHPTKHADADTRPPPKSDPSRGSPFPEKKPGVTSVDEMKSADKIQSQDVRRKSKEGDKPSSRRNSKQKDDPKDKDKDKDKNKDKDEKKKCKDDDCEQDEQDHPSGMTFAQFRNFLMHSTCTEIGAVKKSTIHMCNEYCRGGCKRVPIEDDDDEEEEEEEYCTCCQF